MKIYILISSDEKLNKMGTWEFAEVTYIIWGITSIPHSTFVHCLPIFASYQSASTVASQIMQVSLSFSLFLAFLLFKFQCTRIIPVSSALHIRNERYLHSFNKFSSLSVNEITWGLLKPTALAKQVDSSERRDNSGCHFKNPL